MVICSSDGDGSERPNPVGRHSEPGLILAMQRLPGDTRKRMVDRDVLPVDGGGVGHWQPVQNTNQPQKRASASRKKKTLATPPPKIR